MVSLLTLSEMLGTVPETVMWESQTAFFLLGHDISFLKAYFSLKKVRKHKDTDWSKFFAMHQFSHSMNPVSMQYTVEVELTVKKQNDLFMVLFWSEKSWNICERRLYSEWSFVFLYCQSASAFMELGRYSAVVIIPWCRRYFQFLLLIPLNCSW